MSEPHLQEPLRPIRAVLIGGAITGGLAAAATAIIDVLWSWRALDQFVPGGLGRARVGLYLATSYALCGLAAGAAIAAIGVLYLRVTRLGTLVRHVRAEHARVRRRDPRDALAGLSLVLAYVPIATVLLVLAFPPLVRDLDHRRHFPAKIAVAMAASVAVLVVALVIAILVARLIEVILQALAIGRSAQVLASPWAPAIALGLMIAVGGGVVIALTWKTVSVLHLRAPVTALVALVLAIPLVDTGNRLAARWLRLPPRHRRGAAIAAPLVLFMLTTVAGNRAAIIKGAVAYSGGGDPLTRAWKRLVDRDRDGYSAWFGGDDCDDGDPAVHPGASDTPDDGIDQNCVNGDARSKRSPAEVGFVPVPTAVPPDANVLLITIDTLRADHVGAYGYPRGTTPTLDAIAAEGTLFAAAWAHAPSTRYSMPAILTGRLPLDVYYDTSIPGWPGIQTKATTIAELLRDRGLAGGAFTNYWYFDKSRHMDQGFEVYDNDNARLHQGADPAHTRGSSSREQTDKAIGFVAGHSAQRFFLWVHYYDPHHEYEAHAGFERLGTGEIDRYDQEIAYTDQQLGRLVADLKSRGLWAKTIVVITGDHGEGFGEHGVQQHGYDLYAQQTKVPLIIRVPGLAPRHSRTAVGHVDILPTLANLVGAEPSTEMMGHSLLGLIAGTSPDDPTRAVFQQLSYEGNHEKRGAATADCHVLYNVSPHTSWEIYRLGEDPAETRDRSSPPGPCATVKDTFAAWYDNAQIPAGAGDALLTERPTIAQPLDIDFGDELRLLAIDLPAEVHPGQSFELTWTFEARGRLTGGWKVFVHLESSNGRFTADHAPTRPFEWWQRGQYIRYTTTATVPASTPAGDYGLWMGVWRKSARRTVRAPAQFRTLDNRVRAASLKVVR